MIDTVKVNLTDKLKLFNEQLPAWERYIAKLSYGLLQSRAVDPGLLGADDIRQELRLALWDAVSKYDPERTGKDGRKAELPTWIIRLLRQKCILLMQAHWDKLKTVPLNYTTDEGEEVPLEVEDKEALTLINRLFERDWFDRYRIMIDQVLVGSKDDTEPYLGTVDEKKIFRMILSGRYATDSEIAEELGLNFAKVGEVRLKAKLVLAIMEEVPIQEVTKDKSSERLSKRLRYLLGKHVNSVPALVR